MKAIRILCLLIFAFSYSGCTLLSGQEIEEELRHSITTGETNYFVVLGQGTRAVFADWRSEDVDCLIDVKRGEVNSDLFKVKASHHAVVRCAGYEPKTFRFKGGWGQHAGKVHILGYFSRTSF